MNDFSTALYAHVGLSPRVVPDAPLDAEYRLVRQLGQLISVAKPLTLARTSDAARRANGESVIFASEDPCYEARVDGILLLIEDDYRAGKRPTLDIDVTLALAGHEDPTVRALVPRLIALPPKEVP